MKDMPEPAEMENGNFRCGYVALVGRPNVGKSSMINAIMGQERMMVSEIAGTTRDSVDTLLSYNQYNYLHLIILHYKS